MRISLPCFIATVFLIGISQGSSADSLEGELLEMQKRMDSMEARLQSAQDQIQAAEDRTHRQQAVLEEAGVATGRSAASGLSAFLEKTEFSGFMAGSYNYNFNQMKNSGNENKLPLHRDENSFTFDQFVLEMSKAASAEDRAGYNLAIMFGRGADIKNGTKSGSAGSEFWIQSANIEYLAPNDFHITAGIFGTPIGAESVFQRGNFNITRGLVWDLQPGQHSGVMVAKDVGAGWDVSVGIANDNDHFNAAAEDNNRSKSLLGHIGYAGENWSASLQTVWGAEGESSGPKTMVIDAIATWDPCEALSLWANLDYYKHDDDSSKGGDPRSHQYALALAGRYAFNDRTGLALRGEVVTQKAIQSGSPKNAATSPNNAYSLTATTDYALTSNLTIRGELRYDEDVRFKFTDSNGPERDQTVGLIEMLYAF